MFQLKKITTALMAGAVISSVAMADGFETKEQKFSYGAGFQIGSQLKADMGDEVSMELLRQGLEDALEGAESKVSVQDFQEAYQQIQSEKRVEAQQQAEENRKASEAFLAENAKREGVTVTESGLQYEVLQAGEEGAASPTKDDAVKVHYTGTLADGTVFDSSVERGEPVQFEVSGVIVGFREALTMMKVGDKWKVFIPSDIAYGPVAQGQIPSNSALVFEIELFEVIKDEVEEAAESK